VVGPNVVENVCFCVTRQDNCLSLALLQSRGIVGVLTCTLAFRPKVYLTLHSAGSALSRIRFACCCPRSCTAFDLLLQLAGVLAFMRCVSVRSCSRYGAGLVLGPFGVVLALSNSLFYQK
jgi:hypothetical protein